MTKPRRFRFKTKPEDWSAAFRRSAELQKGCPVELIEEWERACLFGTCDICGIVAAKVSRRGLDADYANTEPPFPRGCLCRKCNIEVARLESVIDPTFIVGEQKYLNYLRDRDHRYEYLKG